jgi:hypothetical protein
VKNTTIIILIAALILVLVIFRKPINKTMTRGYRNNNPGNIRLTRTFWKGEVKGNDKAFKTFSSMSWGYRALFALLKEYISKGYNSIATIINRYAPGNENDTEAYIKTVCDKTGIGRDIILSFDQVLKIKKLVKAISFVENGVAADDVDVENGFFLLKT